MNHAYLQKVIYQGKGSRKYLRVQVVHRGRIWHLSVGNWESRSVSAVHGGEKVAGRRGAKSMYIRHARHARRIGARAQAGPVVRSSIGRR